MLTKMICNNCFTPVINVDKTMYNKCFYHSFFCENKNQNIKKILFVKQAISARERALYQLTVCFEFEIRSDRRKGHKSCALEMVLRRKLRR